MKKSLIVAMAQNSVIGKDNQLPWDMPADMRHFRKTTTGYPIIMGRKTYESIGSKPLKNRMNIVLTRKSTGTTQEECYMMRTIEEAFQKAAASGAKEAFVIGGSAIYRCALPLVDKLYITEIHANISGDIYFPSFDLKEWQEISREEYAADERNEYPYAFVVYERKKK